MGSSSEMGSRERADNTQFFRTCVIPVEIIWSAPKPQRRKFWISRGPNHRTGAVNVGWEFLNQEWGMQEVERGGEGPRTYRSKVFNLLKTIFKELFLLKGQVEKWKNGKKLQWEKNIKTSTWDRAIKLQAVFPLLQWAVSSKKLLTNNSSYAFPISCDWIKNIFYRFIYLSFMDPMRL